MYFPNHLILVLIARICLIESRGNVTSLIDVIIDFISNQKPLAKASINVCWSDSERLYLARQLTNNFIGFQYNIDVNESRDGLLSAQWFLLDLRCPAYKDLLQNANDKMLFKHPYRWLVIKDDMQQIRTDLNIMPDSQFYVINQTSADLYAINSIYKVRKDDDHFVIMDIAKWSSLTKFIYCKYLYPGRNRTNLMKTNLIFSMVITDPDSLNHLWDYRNRHIDSMTKLNYFFCHHVTDYLNASISFIVRDTWGYRNKTTKLFSGMIGDLESGLAEIGGSPAVLAQDRMNAIEYIAPTTPTRAKFIFIAPPLSFVTNILTSPFDVTVWYCTFLLTGVIGIVIYIIVTWEWKNPVYREMLEDQQFAIRANISDVLIMTLGAICQEGSEAEPKSNSGRIATITVFISVMFLYTFYSANIVALLQSTSESIQTIEDLLNSQIKLGVDDIAFNRYFLKEQTDRTRKAIYAQKIAPDGQPANFMNATRGIQKVKNEFFAFHVECAVGYKIIADTFEENEKCRLQEIAYCTEIGNPWMAIKKNSSYKEVAKVAFRKLHENGLQSREFRKIYYNKKPVCELKGSSVTSVGLRECYYCFLIFGIGTALSVSLLVLEMCIKKQCLH